MSFDTPWGQSQTETKIAEGLINYITASHGGIWLSRERIANFPKPLLPFIDGNVDCKSGEGWFEEDCDWAFVAIAYPEYFKDYLDSSSKTLLNYYPDAWEAFYRKKIEPGESYALDEKLFHEKHANDFIVTCAWGSWAEHVPQGMVGVLAIRGGREKGVCQNAERAYWLVPQSEYDTNISKQFGFVINSNVHQRLNVELGVHK